jgi:hypothetical protein
VPKKDVFGAYADFCAEHRYESTTLASFGKFLKKVHITTTSPPPTCCKSAF